MRFRFMSARLTAVTALAVVGAGLASVPLTAAGAATATGGSSRVNVPVFTPALNVVGQVNLGTLARAAHATKVGRLRQGAPISRAALRSVARRYRAVDAARMRRVPSGRATYRPRPATSRLTTANVPGEIGFSALGGVQQANTFGGLDLEPPDQGLCAGDGYVMDFVNSALAVYDEYGDQLVQPVGAPAMFKQPITAFFSDPRCYFDPSSQRWFVQMFTVGTTNMSGGLVTPSTQFEAVSNTSDPTGSYTIYSWDTSDTATKGCPCFGDYDNLGADDNGIYIATDEFGISSNAYNGVIIYAISKQELETYAITGIKPVIFGYRITSDPFGAPEIIAPASSPPGAQYAPNTEYFIESNPDRFSDNHLLVYAMHDTSLLAQPFPPSVFRTEVTTEGYSFPPDAKQKPGVRPLGAATQDPEGQIQADFDAEMEPTYADGHLYGQLDTGTASGSDAIDWFIMTPKLSGSTLSATVDHQGVVAVSDTSLMYPYTAVNWRGVGYLLFSLSGPNNYPSPAYIRYGATGPTGPVMEPTTGAGPDDGFTCYAAFVGPNYGGCRWGDYSMGVVMNGRVYMAGEMIPQGYRDMLTNWGTYIWSAPPPAS